MIEIRSPEPVQRGDLFLAGGISGTGDWQRVAIQMLDPVPGIVINPRRRGQFDPADSVEQIRWEHYALRSVEAILFWFTPETVCPITLFELGVWSTQPISLHVGTHPMYQRRLDVVEQLSLARPQVVVHDSLDDVIAEYVSSLSVRSLVRRG